MVHFYKLFMAHSNLFWGISKIALVHPLKLETRREAF
jgi:hypothetical protein